MSKTPIQWHTANENEIPKNVAGDHVYFAKTGIFVNDKNGVMQKVANNNESDKIACVADTEHREGNTKPSDYKCCLKLNNLKQSKSIGLTSNGYWSHVLGLNAWDDNTARSYELAFSGNDLFMRHNNSVSPTDEGYDKWNSWDRFIRQSEYNKVIGENDSNGYYIIGYIKRMKEVHGLMRGSFNCGYVTGDSDLPNAEKDWGYLINYDHLEGNHYKVEATRSLSNDIYVAIVDIDTQLFVKGWERITKDTDPLLWTNKTNTMAKGCSIKFTSANTDNGIGAGNGDGATLETCNLDLFSWYGIGIKSTQGSNGRTVAINTRTGDIQTKGDIVSKDINITAEITNLKNNVVNWKQPIVTAVNNVFPSSFTTESKGNDIASYIKNTLFNQSRICFTKLGTVDGYPKNIECDAIMVKGLASQYKIEYKTNTDCIVKSCYMNGKKNFTNAECKVNTTHYTEFNASLCEYGYIEFSKTVNLTVIGCLNLSSIVIIKNN